MGQVVLLAFQRKDEFTEREQAEGVDQQWLLAIHRFARNARRCPVGPFAQDSKRTHLGVAQVQRLYSRAFPDLQHSKSATTKGMKRMGYLSESQNLIGRKCSSKQPSTRLRRWWGSGCSALRSATRI